jgi:hypothetical protein
MHALRLKWSRKLLRGSFARSLQAVQQEVLAAMLAAGLGAEAGQLLCTVLHKHSLAQDLLLAVH